MRVVVHPADRGGCGSYRMIWPAEAAKAQGHDVRVVRDETYPVVHSPGLFGDRPTPLGLCADRRELNRIIAAGRSELALLERRGATLAEMVKANRRFMDEARRHIDAHQHEALDADVYVFQRPLERARVEFIECIQRAGAAVVVEVDDDFHTVHPLNPAWKGSNPLHNPDHNRDWLKRACERADLVTVSTPALAERYGGHGRVRVLANCIPEWYLTIGTPGYESTYNAEHALLEPDGRVMVGWSGSVATHRGDLEAAGGGIAQAVRDTGARFGVVGTGKGVRAALGLDTEPDATGWLPIEAYPEALARFDVGVVPLAATAFNEAKSALKMMEFAAVGVPSVVSPTDDNLRMAEALGLHTVCGAARDWRMDVADLIEDADLRNLLAEQVRSRVRAHTIEGNAWRWVEAWSDALTNRRQSRAA